MHAPSLFACENRWRARVKVSDHFADVGKSSPGGAIRGERVKVS